MGSTIGAVLAAILVALVRYFQQRDDFRDLVLAKVAKDDDQRAHRALRWLADAAADQRGDDLGVRPGGEGDRLVPGPAPRVDGTP